MKLTAYSTPAPASNVEIERVGNGKVAGVIRAEDGTVRKFNARLNFDGAIGEPPTFSVGKGSAKATYALHVGGNLKVG